ncbi:flavoprotein [Cardiosporidium cionae]|uniref:Flavoprotein n=1 Tax=Cardiosporidium cionae TaxID=476202 RepID=A0ABQ7JDG3_9APIC|nr:flavoprotein [Cardiosporidium cionae]|eukprot:KAF8822039.1 flavoprotein [Cardiosporidium cionae]
MSTSSSFFSEIHVLIGVTGSVATIKLNEIIAALEYEGRSRNVLVKIKIIATTAALSFIEKSWNLEILTDNLEWESWKIKGDDILHIELRRWADIFVICPLGANTLAKLSNGICDNLLTCVARAWDFTHPFIVFPAMNTLMWEHPLTSRHVSTLQSFGIKVVEPISKILACGDNGKGGLPTVSFIVENVFNMLNL